MATRSKSKAKTAIKATALSSMVSLVLVSQTTQTSQAAVLCGYLQTFNQKLSAGQSQAKAQTAVQAQDSSKVANKAKGPIASEIENSLPSGFVGTWHCVSVVIDSQVDTVPIGDQIISDINFYRSAEGKVKARWMEPGWTETLGPATTFNAQEACLDHTSYYFADGNQGAWAARSRDQFKQLDPNTMMAKSYVDQYIDGQYCGRYRTTSVLTREQAPSAIATTNQAN